MSPFQVLEAIEWLQPQIGSKRIIFPHALPDEHQLQGLQQRAKSQSL